MRFGIRRKMLLLALSGGVLAVLVLGLILFFGAAATRDMIADRGRLLINSASDFVSTFAGEQVRLRLSSQVADRAHRIERELEHTRRVSEALAQTMTLILSREESYLPRALPHPLEDAVASGEPYLHLSPAADANGMGAGTLREMGIASNIADSLASQTPFYRSAYVGSKNGWLIAADVSADGAPIRFSEKFLYSYDPREMGWYKLAAAAGKSVFTDLYTDSNGVSCLSCATPFYDGNGLAGVASVDCNLEELYQEALRGDFSRSVSVSFIMNKNGEILFSTQKEGEFAASGAKRDLRQSGDKSLAREAKAMAEGKSDVALVTVNGRDVYLAYAPLESIGWSFGTLVSQVEVTYPADYAKDNLLTQMEGFSEDIRGLVRRLAGAGAALLLLALLAVAALSAKMSGRVVRPILLLTAGVNDIAQGNLERKLDIRTGDEIEHLAECVNSMTENLKAYMENLAKATADKERIKAELSIAQRIQEGLLPSVAPAFSGQAAFDMDAGMNPAKEVGGDFYDFYMLDANRLAVTVADVSGKGVPAALFMVGAKTMLQNFAVAAKEGGSLSDVVARANDAISKNNGQMMFVTVFFGVLDLRTGVFDYVNAGHNPPLAALSGAPFAYIVPEGKPDKPLGLVEGLAFHCRSLALAPGDTLFLYTDGVTEAANEAQELYGENRLEAALNRAAGGDVPMREILAAVRKDIESHVGAAEQSDDITMLALRYKKET